MVKLGTKLFIDEERFQCISRANGIIVLKKISKELPKVEVVDNLADLKTVTTEELLLFSKFYKNNYNSISKSILLYIGLNYIGLPLEELCNGFDTNKSNARALIWRVANSTKSKDKSHKIVLSLLKWKKQQ